MAARFKVEHVSVAPAGYKVRTVVRQAHRVRIAYPPGRRIRGAGRVVQVLHPLNENPCRLPNPMELVVLANPPGVATHFEPSIGKYVATMYDPKFGNLHSSGSTEAAAKKALRKQLRDFRTGVRSHNPSGEAAATELYEKFHGLPSKHIDEIQEPSARGVAMAKLGELLEIRVKPDGVPLWGKLILTGRGVVLASNPAGTQLYCVGGDQAMTKAQLTLLGADASKDLIDLGQAMYIAYRTKKGFIGSKNASFEHALGEETQRRPRLLYDRRGSKPRLQFAGGEYRIEAPGIIN
jgi:hypothetical protein